MYMRSSRKNRKDAEEELVNATARLLGLAGEGLERSLFLNSALGILGEHAHCDTVLLHSGSPGLKALCDKRGQIPPPASCRFFDSGSFFIDDTVRFCRSLDDPALTAFFEKSGWSARFRSALLIRLNENSNSGDYLQFSSERLRRFSSREALFLEALSRVFAVALGHWRVTWSLQERVKELSCLYRIANVLDPPGKSIGDIMGEIIEIIPSAWLYDDDAVSRIQLDGQSYASRGYEEGKQEQSADIVLAGRVRGCVQVAYLSRKPELGEGPFLAEERKLLDTIAKELSLRIERRLYEEEQAKIKEQLKHSNRLAVIGQLAAAVAHELNEPLTNILGFAQLAAREPGLSSQCEGDLEKIIGNSLHAREIVRKLLLHGRKMPQRKTVVDVNKVIKEALSFFEHRLSRERIALELRPPDAPMHILADPAHLRQVLVNLVLNAMQSMPAGGTLAVSVLSQENRIEIRIRDTGCGISEAIRDKIFIPFFTTKEPGHGTGLGLSVVQEIVTGMNGAIRIESTAGIGTTALVNLPAAEAGLSSPKGDEDL